MRLFEKITSAFRTQQPEKSNPNSKPIQEIRIQQRYSFPNASLGAICTQSECFPIQNLSYSGVGVSFSSIEMLRSAGLASSDHQVQVQVQLNLLGRSVAATIQLVFEKDKRAGYFFVHSTGDTLLFLRDSLEYMRRGAQMSTIDPSLLKERFRDQNWKIFRGAESDDVRVRLSDDGKTFEEALITFLDGGEYCEVCILGDVFSTRRTSQKRGSGQAGSPTTTQTAELDFTVLRAGLALIIGLSNSRSSNFVEPLVQKIWERYSAEAN
jgi:hypothetical protein